MEILKGITRNKTGTTSTRQLRAQGMTPGVIYGHGLANVAFAVNSHELELMVKHGELLVKLSLDGQEDNYLVKEVQRDAFDNEIIHVDFARVSLDETVEVTVPVTFKGTAAGEKEGGVLNYLLTSVAITCPVVKIPEEIIVRVSELKLGDVLHVGDLPHEGFDFVTDDDVVVVSCSAVAEEPEAPAEGEQPAEPEVIGRAKAEDENEQE